MMREGKDRTMDRKQMVKNIAKHKTSIFISTIVLFAAVVFVYLFCSLEKQGKDQQKFSVKEQERFAEEQKQLADMEDYLGEIDSIVTANAEHLAETGLVQMETERVLTEFSEGLSKLEERLLYVENLVNGQDEKQTGRNSEILLSITELSESQKEVGSQITAVNTAITSVLSDLREAEERNFTAVFEELKNLKEALEETEKQTKDYYSELEGLIVLLQEENKEEHQELAEALAEAGEDILSLLDDGFSGMGIQMEQDFAALMERLGNLHNQIAAAENSIASLLRLMDEKDGDRQEEIREAFAVVGLSLEQIKEDYTDAYREIGNLIQKLEETGRNNHAEMLSALTVMENNMSESSMQNLAYITESLQGMEENFSASINNMQSEMEQKFSSLNSEMAQNMSEYNSSMSEMIDRIDTNITNQYQNLSNTVNNYDRGQQESLNNFMNAIERKLQQVFQSVSNGKQKVASALLTKGVSIKKDATFDEIYKGILSIPQELVIGVQEIPGTISYEQHYHVNGSGGKPHSEKVTAKGGCYTVPVYHTHTGDSRSGGGCYTVPITHSHVDSCYTVTKTVRRVTSHWYTGEGTGHACCAEAFGQNRARYAYVDEVYINDELVSSSSGEGDLGYCCGLCFDRKAAEMGYTTTETAITCGYSEGLNGYRTGCGKNDRTVEAYTPGCGFVDGQIIGAHITYDKNAVNAISAVAAMCMEETYETPIVIAEEKQTVSGNVPESGEKEAGDGEIGKIMGETE